MAYKEVHTQAFLDDVKDAKKDNVLIERLHKKMDEILENPEHYPPKQYNLKGKRAVHVGSFVVVFEIKGSEVVFHRFKHHDLRIRDFAKRAFNVQHVKRSWIEKKGTETIIVGHYADFFVARIGGA